LSNQELNGFHVRRNLALSFRALGPVAAGEAELVIRLGFRKLGLGGFELLGRGFPLEGERQWWAVPVIATPTPLPDP
jgi:hypothetical protein